MSRRIRRVLLAAMAAAGMCPLQAGTIIDLGLADEFTISQPVVQVQVGRFGPLDLNEYLLDTGASGILAGANSSAELRSLGLVTEATYVDFGVAGPQSTGVSRAYDFYFAGSDGVPRTLPGARLQTSNGNFAFYSGIAGMPLMTGRTVGFDLAAQADMNALRIGVAFDVPFSPTPAANQLSVPLTMYTFPASGQQNPTDPLPENAALPFAPVRLQYGATTGTAGFLLDTGAQQCILSQSMAFDLGLDVNRNGTLDDEAISFQTVAGVGGTIEIPVLRIDALSLQTSNDVELLFRDITVGIIDIDPALPGVLGMNILNSGWEIHALNTFLGLTPSTPGIFPRVDLDFRQAAASLQAEMRLSLTAGLGTTVTQAAVTASPASGVQTQAQAGFLAIGGTSSLLKTGAGTLVLDAVNTLTGTTEVREGTLRLATPSALVGSPTVVRSGATLQIATGSGARLPRLTLAGGTLDAGGLLAVNGTSGIGTLVVADGTLAGRPGLVIGSGGEVRLEGVETAVAVGSLAIDRDNGGLLDVGAGRIEIAAGGIGQAELLAALLAGRGDGSWAGRTGIGSAAALADVAAGSPRGVGWLDAGDGSFVVGYAAPGDTNLDGAVDILDAANFTEGASARPGESVRWATGDFTYDGVVDVLDIGEFVSTGLFDAGSYYPAGSAAAVGPVSAVPEPAVTVTAVAVCVAACGLQRKKPRRQRPADGVSLTWIVCPAVQPRRRALRRR
jgi:autotransporter-associated beta strand protein